MRGLFNYFPSTLPTSLPGSLSSASQEEKREPKTEVDAMVRFHCHAIKCLENHPVENAKEIVLKITNSLLA